MPTVYTLEQYKKLTGVTDDKMIDKFKEDICSGLRKENSALKSELGKLSEGEKSLLITALTTNNAIIINQILIPILSKSQLDIDIQYLPKITGHEHSGSTRTDYWLNPTVSLLIDKMIHSNTNDAKENS